ncbi:MAG TPA: PHP domain-containing protein [Deltaproteobacteria bacterium]|nr:PHP domain-containing protein [Deltaproteobacteria bacterium]
MNNNKTNDHFEYVGNLHIHSRYSDGGGSVREIARSARTAGLDFIILNDHNYMTDTLHLEDEGNYDGLIVLMGLELGRRYHHYLAFDLPEMVRAGGLSPQGVIDLGNRNRACRSIANHYENDMPFTETSIAYTWNDLSVTKYTGICIWNFSSRWKERVTNPLTGLFFLLFKTRMLKGPSKKTLSFWDRQCRQRRVAAIGGSDAHGSLFKWGVLRFIPLPYDYTLNSITVHLLSEKNLSGKFNEAKDQIYGGLRQGRLFIANEKVAPAVGFRFFYISESGSNLTMGEEATFKRGILFIETPDKGEIRLLKDGAVLKKWRGSSAFYEVEESGVYRVEVYHRLLFFEPRPWIFSNPIYLR